MAAGRVAMSQCAYNDLVDVCRRRGWTIGLSVLDDAKPHVEIAIVQITIWASASRRYHVSAPVGDHELGETLDRASARMFELLSEDEPA